MPAIVISPLARRGHVVDPLSVRDAEANNLAEVLDFSRVDPCPIVV